MNTNFRLVCGVEKLTVVNSTDDVVARIEINPLMDMESKLTTNQVLMEIFSGKKRDKEISIEIIKIAEKYHNSPRLFIEKIFDFVNKNLGEDFSKFPREKFERIFDKLYSKDGF